MKDAVSNFMGQVVFLAKWPVGILVALSTPAMAAATWAILAQGCKTGTLVGPFSISMAATMIVWLWARRIQAVQFWCTLEHELTHALFAYLTLIPVTELKVTHWHRMRVGRGNVVNIATDQASGHVLTGGSNWLVAIAPYFFPTASLIVVVATWALAEEPTTFAHVMLGIATGFSVASTWQELHPGQSDLTKVGRAYCWIVLPGLNLAMYGGLLAFDQGGTRLVHEFFLRAYQASMGWLV